MSKFFSLIAVLFIFSCSAQIESPVVYLSNASAGSIKSIECNWNGNILTLANLNPGDTRSLSFFINRESQFFGPIYISWYNAEGDRMSKNFNFKKENLPSIVDRTTYNYVQLYIDQEDVEVTTSDVADLTGKVRRMEQVMNKYHDEFLKSGIRANLCANNNLNVCQNADSSGLIAIKKKQTELTPGTY